MSIFHEGLTLENHLRARKHRGERRDGEPEKEFKDAQHIPGETLEEHIKELEEELEKKETADDD